VTTTKVYRVVSVPEYQSIIRKGFFSPGPNSLEGKWFADTLEGARLHRGALYGFQSCYILEADVPDNASSLFKVANLDGRGPARYLDVKDLRGVRPRLASGS
jgi:hypothetical protein